MHTRDPGPALRPFVATLWATRAPQGAQLATTIRERVLPTGAVHVAFRLSDEPLRVHEDVADASGSALAPAVVGGARSRFYLRSGPDAVGSVGAQLRPGAAECLVGSPAGELAGRHVSLVDLWGGAAARMRTRLLEASSPERQLDLLESVLTARLARVRALHPAVAEALARFRTTPDVRAAVRATGYSHRRVVELFRAAVGLSPKRYCRIQRFQRALDRFAAAPSAAWADVAAASGYSDQSHLHREFREFAGVTPGEYRRLAPRFPNHVPVPPAPP
jgi:AraC-like DNA-binding protein